MFTFDINPVWLSFVACFIGPAAYTKVSYFNTYHLCHDSGLLLYSIFRRKRLTSSPTKSRFIITYISVAKLFLNFSHRLAVSTPNFKMVERLKWMLWNSRDYSVWELQLIYMWIWLTGFITPLFYYQHIGITTTVQPQDFNIMLQMKLKSLKKYSKREMIFRYGIDAYIATCRWHQGTACIK